MFLVLLQEIFSYVVHAILIFQQVECKVVGILNKMFCINVINIFLADPNDWIDGTYDFNKLPFAVRMQKGLVTQAEEERRKGRYGYLSDLIPSFGATHFPDGRAKNKAVTMW